MSVGSATPVPLLAPSLEVLEDTTAAGVRALWLHIASPRRADAIFVYGDPNARVLAAEVENTPFPEPKPGSKVPALARFHLWSFEYYGPPPEGFDLRLRVEASAAPLQMVLVDQSYSLAGSGAPPRPAATMPFPWFTDSVLVRKSFTLPGL